MTTTIIPQPGMAVNPSVYLSPKTREIYRALCNLCTHKGYAWITNEALAEEYGKSLPTANRYVRLLRQLGLIRVEIDCRNVYAKRKIYCLVPLKCLRPGGFVLGDPNAESSSKNETTNGDSLPIKEITRKATTTAAPVTPDEPPAVPVVASSGCDSPIRKCSETSGNIRQSTTTGTDADAPTLVKQLTAQGISSDAACKLAKDRPDECRRQLATYNPAAHRRPAGYLRRAIEHGWQPDAPQTPIKVVRMPVQRRESVSVKKDTEDTRGVFVSALSMARQASKAVAGKWRERV